jgi:hypothetical protein
MAVDIIAIDYVAMNCVAMICIVIAVDIIVINMAGINIITIDVVASSSSISLPSISSPPITLPFTHRHQLHRRRHHHTDINSYRFALLSVITIPTNAVVQYHFGHFVYRHRHTVVSANYIAIDIVAINITTEIDLIPVVVDFLIATITSPANYRYIAINPYHPYQQTESF